MKQWAVDQLEDCWFKVTPWSVTRITSPFLLILITTCIRNNNVIFLLFLYYTQAFQTRLAVNASSITGISKPDYICFCTNLFRFQRLQIWLYSLLTVLPVGHWLRFFGSPVVYRHRWQTCQKELCSCQSLHYVHSKHSQYTQPIKCHLEQYFEQEREKERDKDSFPLMSKYCVVVGNFDHTRFAKWFHT